MNPELQGKCLLKAQKKMLCEKDTTSELHTLFAKGDAVSRDMKSGIGSWRVTASVQNFLLQNGGVISHDVHTSP